MIQSAGVVVIDWRQKKEPSVLCIRAWLNWDFPKGKVESGETLIEAATRELFEETSLRVPDDVKLFDETASASVTYGRNDNRKTATYYLGTRVSNQRPYLPISPELGYPENDEYRWIPLSQLHQLMPPRLDSVVKFVIDRCDKKLHKRQEK